MRALGYDMNSCEWAIRDGVPSALDFMNPAPDMDIYSLTPHYFEWAVKTMADMAIKLSKHPRPQIKELRWNEMFGAAQGTAREAELVAGADGPETVAAAASRRRAASSNPAPADDELAASVDGPASAAAAAGEATGAASRTRKKSAATDVTP
jgi:hypothetical protein